MDGSKKNENIKIKDWKCDSFDYSHLNDLPTYEELYPNGNHFKDCSKCDKIVDTLNIKEGDILVLRGTWELQDCQTLGASLGVKGCKPLVILLGDGNSIEAIDEAEMEKYGWVRKGSKGK
jgi:hypothetical protein